MKLKRKKFHKRVKIKLTKELREYLDNVCCGREINTAINDILMRAFSKEKEEDLRFKEDRLHWLIKRYDNNEMTKRLFSCELAKIEDEIVELGLVPKRIKNIYFRERRKKRKLEDRANVYIVYENQNSGKKSVLMDDGDFVERFKDVEKKLKKLRRTL